MLQVHFQIGVNLSILIISSPLHPNFKNIQTMWRGTIPLYSSPHYSPPLYSPLLSSLSKLPNRPLLPLPLFNSRRPSSLEKLPILLSTLDRIT